MPVKTPSRGLAGGLPGRVAPAVFEIPGRLPGANEASWKERSHWAQGYRFRKKLVRLIGEAVIAGRVPFFEVPVTVYIRWVEPDLRRDRDNIHFAAKWILDALVKTRRLKGDSQRWVKDVINVRADPDPRNPRVEVTLVPELSR